MSAFQFVEDGDIIPGPSPPVRLPEIPPSQFPSPGGVPKKPSGYKVLDTVNFVGTWWSAFAPFGVVGAPDPSAFPVVTLVINSDTTYQGSAFFGTGGLECTARAGIVPAFTLPFGGDGWGNGDSILKFADGQTSEGDQLAMQISLTHYPNNQYDDGSGLKPDPVIAGECIINVLGTCIVAKRLPIVLRPPNVES